MAPDVHAVALVVDGAREAADLLRGLEDDRLHASVTYHFKGGGKPRGTGADDHDSGLHELARCGPPSSAQR